MPISDPISSKSGGTNQNFQGGFISLNSDYGNHVVAGRINSYYQTLTEDQRNKLEIPTTDEISDGNGATYQFFKGGLIKQTISNGQVVSSNILSPFTIGYAGSRIADSVIKAYVKLADNLGTPTGKTLGINTGYLQDFDLRMLSVLPTGEGFAITQNIEDYIRSDRGTGFGLATGEGIGQYYGSQMGSSQTFQNGKVFYHPQFGTHGVLGNAQSPGSLGHYYETVLTPTQRGQLGVATSEQIQDGNLKEHQSFQGGTIYSEYNSSTVVVYRFSTESYQPPQASGGGGVIFIGAGGNNNNNNNSSQNNVSSSNGVITINLTPSGGNNNNNNNSNQSNVSNNNIVITTPSIPTNIWKAEYFNNNSLNGSPTFTKEENQINNDWGSGGPGNGIENDNFSVRWQGQFPFEGGNYRFTNSVDDGMRIYVDNNLVHDTWNGRNAVTFNTDVPIYTGMHTIKVEYREDVGDAQAKFSLTKIISATITTPNPSPTSNYVHYTIKAGETLSEIAQNLLGSASNWTKIVGANGNTFTEQQARTLPIGLVVYLPINGVVNTPTVQPIPPTPTPTPISTPAPVNNNRTPYTLKPNDTLSGIAQNILGGAGNWNQITDANGNTFTEQQALSLQIGQVIYLPTNSGVNTPITTPVNPSNPISTSINGKVDDFLGRFIGVTNIGRLDTGDYQGECVSLIARYLQEEYLPASEKNRTLYLGNGKDTASTVASIFPQYFNPVSDPSPPVRGSIISFPSLSSPYGHTAIVTDVQIVDSQSFKIKIVDSNSAQYGRKVLTQDFWITINKNGNGNSGYGNGIVWVNPKDATPNSYPAPVTTPITPIPTTSPGLQLPRSGGSDNKTYSEKLYLGNGDSAEVNLKAIGTTTLSSKSNRPTWIVIHGMNGGKQDDTDFWNSANAVDTYRTDDQVFALDWSQAARSPYSYDDGTPTLNSERGGSWIKEVARFAANTLQTKWGISTDNINIIGHSLGAYVGYEISKQVSGGVNRLVALDPAVTTLFSYDITESYFRSYSQWSWGIYGSIAGWDKAAHKADVSFNFDFDGENVDAHGDVRKVFDMMVRNQNQGAISKMFSLDNVSSSSIGNPWVLRDGEYEGFLKINKKNNQFSLSSFKYYQGYNDDTWWNPFDEKWVTVQQTPQSSAYA
jgi:pimeloyl-ACP methyl ester carboxylesterase/LysM repeat protein